LATCGHKNAHVKVYEIALERQRQGLNAKAQKLADALAIWEQCTRAGGLLLGRRYANITRAVADVNVDAVPGGRGVRVHQQRTSHGPRSG
jgi:hypothetical protein